ARPGSSHPLAPAIGETLARASSQWDPFDGRHAGRGDADPIQVRRVDRQSAHGVDHERNRLAQAGLAGTAPAVVPAGAAARRIAGQAGLAAIGIDAVAVGKAAVTADRATATRADGITVRAEAPHAPVEAAVGAGGGGAW